jgi:hypothetical protein
LPEKKMEPTALLMEDHEKVKGLWRQFEKAGESEKWEIGHKIIMELKVHTKLEEDLFYPECERVEELKDLIAEAIEEHNVVDHVIEEIEALPQGDETFEPKMTVMFENVEHHIEEEEGELFPKARKSLRDLEALAQRMMSHKQELMRQMGMPMEQPETKARTTSRRSTSGTSGRRSAATSSRSRSR